MAEDKKDVWSNVENRFNELVHKLSLSRDVGEGNVPIKGMDRQLQNPLSIITLFACQRELQAKTKGAGNHYDENNGVVETAYNLRAGNERQEKFEKFILAAQSELSEALESSQWKGWKTYTKPLSISEIRNLQLELVDVLFFLLNLMMLSGLTAEEAMALYLCKWEENLNRQVTGYSDQKVEAK